MGPILRLQAPPEQPHFGAGRIASGLLAGFVVCAPPAPGHPVKDEDNADEERSSDGDDVAEGPAKAASRASYRGNHEGKAAHGAAAADGDGDRRGNRSKADPLRVLRARVVAGAAQLAGGVAEGGEVAAGRGADGG